MNLYQSLFEQSPIATFILKKDHFADVNVAALNLFAVADREDFLSRDLSSFFPKFQPDGRVSEDVFPEYMLKGFEKTGSYAEWEFIKGNGEHFLAEVMYSPIEDDDDVLLHVVVRDITHVKKVEKRLKYSEERFRHMLDHSPIALAIADMNGNRVVYANQRYAEMVNKPMSAVIGDNPKHYYVDRIALDQKMRHIYREDTVTDHVAELNIPNRDAIWVSVSYMQMKYRGQTAIMSWFYDVTDLHEAKLLADRANRAKTDFLANMSHELRTPLNSVLGFSDVLLQGDISQAHRQLVETIRNSGQSLLHIINDLLDLSNLEKGDVVLTMLPFNVRTLMTNIEAKFAPQAAKKDLLLAIRVDQAVPQQLKGDAARISQIIANLIDNAIKFTHKGSVLVTFEPSDQQDFWIVSVKDTGIGIDAKSLPNLFSLFSQADTSKTRRYGGAGMGLAVASDLCQLMDGRIEASSSLGGGSVFRCVIKCDVVAMQHNESLTGSALIMHAIQKLNGVRVLLVEDNRINQMLAQKFLEKLSLSADLAEDGLQALALLEKNIYDLVLMDMQMPNMDGLEATRILRSHKDWHQPVVIAVTANAFPEDRAACMSAGMDDFFGKPINIEGLTEVLLNHFPIKA